jgi:formylglycine-generating enzyme required for sulfatase activity
MLYALDPGLVTKVAVFSGTRGYNVFNVTNGSFNAFAMEGEPAGLVFIGAAGNYLGYLKLANGLDSIPVNMAADGVKTIDLATLTSSGNIVEPGHDPMGSEILMSSTDVNSYAFSNGAFGSLMKSPDVDGDGVVDVFNGNYYAYGFTYSVTGGSFEGGLTAVPATTVTAGNYRFGIMAWEKQNPDYPAEVTFHGPAGSGIENTVSDLRFLNHHEAGGDTCGYISPFVASPSIPPAGVYTVSYKTKTLTFNVPDQSGLSKYLVLPVLTFKLNGNGTINSVSWEYRLADGSGTINPMTIIEDIDIQFGSAPGQVPYVFYDSQVLARDATSHTLTNQTILWSSVTQVGTGYHDIFGNHIDVGWDKGVSATQTAVEGAIQTAVAAVATQTAVVRNATQTAVAVVATQTAVAVVNATQTAVAVVATQTAVAAVATQTAVAVSIQTAVIAIQTAVIAVISVPGGTYTQTDGTSSFSHTISTFKMGKYQVTYNLCNAVYQWAVANGYSFANAGAGSGDMPVIMVNWRDVIVWCNAYSQEAGLTPCYTYASAVIKDSTNVIACDNAVCAWTNNGYRLPSEGEYQYAASYIDGLSWTPYNYASGATADYTNAAATGLVAWYSANCSSTQAVGGKTANALGIYDMSGNVWEWCWDWYGTYPGTSTDYRGPGSGSYRVIRGGIFYSFADSLQVGYRSYASPLDGFRFARTN